ncbi:MAG: hypothetical protein RTU30_10445 [Candidatus Thorarchaeota archaeon]
MEVNLITKDEDIPENLVTFKYIIEKGDFFGESIPVSALEEEIGVGWKEIESYLSKETILLSGRKHELKSCYTTRTDKDFGLTLDFEKPLSSDD